MKFITPDMIAARTEAMIHINALESMLSGLELSGQVASHTAVEAAQVKVKKLRWCINIATGGDNANAGE